MRLLWVGWLSVFNSAPHFRCFTDSSSQMAKDAYPILNATGKTTNGRLGKVRQNKAIVIIEVTPISA